MSVSNVNTFASTITEDSPSAKIGISFMNLLSAATNESLSTVAFQVLSPLNGTLYVNVGGTAAGTANYKALSFVATPGNTSDIEVTNTVDVATGNVLELRLTGLYYNNVKLNGGDNKLYWGLATSAPNLNGDVDAFQIKEIDNVNRTWADGDDTAAGLATVKINVIAVNDAPTGMITIDNNSSAGRGIVSAEQYDVLHANSTALVDVDGLGTLHYQWKANGAIVGDDSANYSLTESEVGKTITVSAHYTDGHGTAENISSAATNAIINVNDAPTGTATATLVAGMEDIAYTVSATDLLAGFSDADGNALSVSNLIANHGTVTTNADGSFTITQTTNYNGAVSLTYSVIDGLGGSIAATQSFDIGTVNSAPVVSAPVVLTAINEDSLGITFDATTLLSNSSDIDSSTLFIANFGLATTHASDGTLTQNDNGTWTFVPAADFNGNVTFSYTVSDGIADPVAATASLTVNPVNDSPVVSAPVVLTPITEDSSGITFSSATLLAHSSDVDTATLTVAGVTLTNLAAGALTDHGDGTWTFVPAHNFNGEVAFNYTVSDGTAVPIATMATLAVTPVNDAPVDGTAPPVFHGYEDVPITLTASALRAGITDVDGDTLHISAISVSSGTLVENSNGSWTFHSPENASGDFALTYTVTDGEFTVERSTVITLNPVNDAPTSTNMTGSGAVFMNEDNHFSGLLPEIVDVDNASGTYHLGVDPVHGVVAVAEDGNFTYTPNADYNGNDSFTFTVSDGAPVNKLDYVFVIDDTGSMGGTIDGVKTNVANFVNHLVDAGIDATFGFVRYGENTEGAATFSGFYDATTVAAFQSALSGVHAHGGADTPESGLEALMLVADQTFRPDAIVRAVLLTDATVKDLATGYVYYSGPATFDINETVTALNNKGIILDIAGPTYNRSDEAGVLVVDQLQQITLPTGGVYYDLNAPGFYEGGFGVFNHYYTVEINVAPINDAPVVSAAVVLTAIDEDSIGITFSAATLLAHSSDIDSSTLTVADVALTIGHETDGTITANADGTWTFVPAHNFNGEVAVTYTVSDGVAAPVAASATLAVNPVNDAPVVSAPVVLTAIDEDSIGITFDAASLLAHSSDIDSSTLTVADVALTIGHETDGTITANADGTWTFVPAHDFNGEVTVTYTVIDGVAAPVAASATLTVNPVNDAAILSSAVVALDETNALLTTSGDLTISDVDNPMTFIEQAATVGANGTFGIDTTGHWTFSANSAFDNLNVGSSASSTYDVVSADGTHTSVQITINGTNDVPSSIALSANNIIENTQVTGNGVLIGTLSTVDVDSIDGIHTYTLSGVDAPFFSISNGNELHYVGSSPNYETKAHYDLNIICTDSGNLSVSSGVVVDVINVQEGPQFAGSGDTYITPGHALINGLGGSTGFGENYVVRNDDSYSSSISLTDVFGSGGLNFFGQVFDHFFVNNNGNITFTAPSSVYTPSLIAGVSAMGPMIAAFFADVDTQAGVLTPSPGGTSIGSNLVYWDMDTANKIITVTWDDVGNFPSGTTPNAFQIRLHDTGSGNFTIEVRYESIDWLLGSASGGLLARAGYTASDGIHYYEVPQSGTTEMLNLESLSNIGQPGVWVFNVNNGNVSNPLVATVAEGSTVIIDDLRLNYVDGDDYAANLLYTLTVLPTHGEMRLYTDSTNYTVIAVGGTFHKADVDSNMLRYVHDNSETSLDNFGFSVVDVDLITASGTFVLNITPVNDQIPTLSNNLSILEGASVVLSSLNFSATDGDLPGNALTFTVSSVNHGQFELVANNNVVTSFTRAQLDAGAIKFVHDGGETAPTYDVSVSDGVHTTTAAGTIAFTNVNDPAVLSSAVVTLDQTSELLTTSGDLTISDIDSPQTFVAQTDTVGTHGIFSINDAGHWNFTANSTFANLNIGDRVSDTYDVESADGTHTTVQVTINGTNDAPVISAPVVLTAIDEDSLGITFNAATLLAHSSDIDSSTLTVADVALTIGHETDGTIIANADGTWTFVPAHNFNGEVVVTYTVSDGVALPVAASATLVVNPMPDNVAPVVSAPVVLAAIDEDSIVIINAATLLANTTDGDGDTLSIADVTLADGHTSDGTLTHNVADGTWTFAPAANFNGEVAFNYTVSDGTADPVATTANLTVNHLYDDMTLVPTQPAVTNVAAATQVETFTVTGTAGDIADTYSITINGNTITYETDGSETDAAVIANGLIILLNANADIAGAVTATLTDNIITFTAAVSGTEFTFASSAENALIGIDNSGTADAIVTENIVAVAPATQVETFTVTGTAGETADTYSITINGNTITYETDGSEADSAAIADGLTTLLNANADIAGAVTATLTDNIITITAAVPGTEFTFASNAANAVEGTNNSSTADAIVTENVAPIAAVHQINTVSFGANAYDQGDVVVVTVNGTEFSHAVQYGNSASDISDALVVVINASQPLVTASTVGGVLTLTAFTAGTTFTSSSTVNDISYSDNAAPVANEVTPASSAVAQEATINLGDTAYDAGDIISGDINGAAFTYTVTGAEANNAAIATAVASEISNTGEAVNLDATGAVITITSSVAGTIFTYAASVTTDITYNVNSLTPAHITANDAADAQVTDVTLTGTPDGGDQFTVTINDVAHTVTAGTADVGSDVVDALVVAINTGEQAVNVTASNVAGKLHLISDAAGTSFTVNQAVENAVANVNATTDLTTATSSPAITAVAQVSTAVFGGTVTAGDLYHIVVNGTDHTYTAAAGVTMTSVLNGLVSRINAGAATEFVTAVRSGSTLIIASDKVGTPFTITGSSTDGDPTIATPTPNLPATAAVSQISTIDIGATSYDKGDVINVVVGSTPYSYTVTGSEASNSDIVTELATIIDQNTAVIASNAAGVLTLTSQTAGTAFTFSSNVNNGAFTAASLAINTTTLNDTANGQVETIDFGAIAYDAGDVISGNINGPGHLFSYTVTGLEADNAAIASAVAEAIAATGEAVTPTAVDTVVTITADTAGAAFSIDATVTNIISHTNLTADADTHDNVIAVAETSHVDLGTAAYDAGDVITVTVAGHAYTYTVLGTETNSDDIVTALMSDINSDGINVTATQGTEGVLILTADVADTPFTLTTSIDNAGISDQVTQEHSTAPPNVELINAVAQIETITLADASLDVGDTYQFTFHNGTSGANVITHVVDGSEVNLAGLVHGIINEINADSTISLYVTATVGVNAGEIVFGADAAGTPFTVTPLVTNAASGIADNGFTAETTTANSVQVAQIDLLNFPDVTSVRPGDTLTATVEGTTYTVTAGTPDGATVDELGNTLAAAVAAGEGANLQSAVYDADTDILTLTGLADGTPFAAIAGNVHPAVSATTAIDTSVDGTVAVEQVDLLDFSLVTSVRPGDMLTATVGVHTYTVTAGTPDGTTVDDLGTALAAAVATGEGATLQSAVYDANTDIITPR